MISKSFRAEKKSPVVSKRGRKHAKTEEPKEGLNGSIMQRRVSRRIQANQKSEEEQIERRGVELVDNSDDGKKMGTSRKRARKNENMGKAKRARKDEKVGKNENVGKHKQKRPPEDENVGKEKLVGKKQRISGVSNSNESTKVKGKSKIVCLEKKVDSGHGKKKRVNGVSKSNESTEVKGKSKMVGLGKKVVGLGKKVDSQDGKKQRGKKVDSETGKKKRGKKLDSETEKKQRGKKINCETGKKKRGKRVDSETENKQRGKKVDSETGKKQRGKRVDSETGRKQRVNGPLKSKESTKVKGKSKKLGLEKKVNTGNGKKRRDNGIAKQTNIKGNLKIAGLEKKADSKNGKKQRVYRVSKSKLDESTKVKGKSKVVGLEKNVGSENGGTEIVEKNDSLKVKETLRLFNKYYLHFVQGEEKCSKLSEKGPSKKRKAPTEDTETTSKRGDKRPDLKAITKMIENNEILFPGKRIGEIPGIKVGHQFYSRAEMVVLGFHRHWLNGIDYMGQSYRKLPQYHNYTFPLAVSIVLSGMYEDDLDNAEDVVYTGQGGHNLNGDKRQIQDQELVRGNLALKNCIEQCVPVRVTRGHKFASSYCGKVYTYDGLYKVVSYWAEKGISGFTVYKFRLRRIEGQPTLTTNQVYFTNGRVPQSSAEIRGLVCEDITGGQEDVPIPATNMVDNPPVAPTGFTYSKSIKLSKNVKLPAKATGCKCKGLCTDPKSCACALLNGSDFPYVSRNGGRLIEAKDVVFECGPQCACGPDCVNRTSQRGLRYRLEVFRTAKKGWAVRSWDFIPSGAPVCEYTGILRKTEDLDSVSENNYIFEIDCLQTMKGLGGRERRVVDGALPSINLLDKYDDHNSESVPEFCIDAGSTGNIARFINHGCDPNLFVQCVSSSHHDLKLARVMLFAADNIPPLQELTYDYGYALDSVLGPDGKIKQMACFCGTAGCRKRLF